MADRDECAEVSNAGKGVQTLPHITVCVCTYKRPLPLTRLLNEILPQQSDDLFTYSVVVVDNDIDRSAESTVAEFGMKARFPVIYIVEPNRGISLARNRVLQNADGEYVALIDDDEYPTPGWLLTLFKTCVEHQVDGVLGPVRRHFDEAPPKWLLKSSLFDRKVHETGTSVLWHDARTGNCLLNRRIFMGDASPFRAEYTAGEDEDFFRRKISKGFKFIWCGDAEVFEVIPPARCKRMYCARKALLQGVNAARYSQLRTLRIAKSTVAIPIYTLALPFALLLGQHRFMELLVKLCDHLGQFLMSVGINPVQEEYISD
jgi:succinoglycan biosynthesis protein ExoM